MHYKVVTMTGASSISIIQPSERVRPPLQRDHSDTHHCVSLRLIGRSLGPSRWHRADPVLRQSLITEKIPLMLVFTMAD